MLSKLEKINLFFIKFFTTILWRKVVKDGEKIPSGPFMLTYQDYDTKRGIFWLFPVAIFIRSYRVTAYMLNLIRKKPTFFDKHLQMAMEDGFREGYNQSIIDSKGTDRRLKLFQNKIKSKTNSGLNIN